LLLPSVPRNRHCLQLCTPPLLVSFCNTHAFCFKELQLRHAPVWREGWPPAHSHKWRYADCFATAAVPLRVVAFCCSMAHVGAPQCWACPYSNQGGLKQVTQAVTQSQLPYIHTRCVSAMAGTPGVCGVCTAATHTQGFALPWCRRHLSGWGIEPTQPQGLPRYCPDSLTLPK
jgi:hypothetical protein